MPSSHWGHFGQDVSLGDVDDNGEFDIAVSAVSASPLGCDGCGAVYVVRNAKELPRHTLDADCFELSYAVLRSGLDTRYGYHVALGDLDGDGRDDLAVSNRPLVGNQRARAVVVFASAMVSDTLMLASDPSFTRIHRKKSRDLLGSSLAAADLQIATVPSTCSSARVRPTQAISTVVRCS